MALYRCIAQGGAAATDITPSNSTPASMSADGVYHATAAGYAIASYNSVTPSNSTPAALTSGDIDKMGANGYAIESYSNVTPSDSTPASISSGSIYKASANGVAIASSPTALAPSNSSPASISSGTIYKASASGKAVESITNVTPSNSSPVALSSGDIDKIGGAGYAIESYSSLTPSYNGTAISDGEIYKAGGDGYAISTYQTITPSEIAAPFYTGFVKMLGNGYAYSRVPSVIAFTNAASSVSTASSTLSLSNLNGKKLLVLAFYTAGSATAYNRLDGATASGGTIHKLCNLRSTNATAYGTFYNLSVTSDSCTLTAPYNCFWQVFGTE